MIGTRCQYCGRTIEQSRYLRYKCGRCFDGNSKTLIAHTKAVRLAYKHRRTAKLYQTLYAHRVKVDKMFPTIDAAILYLHRVATFHDKFITLTLDDRADLTPEDHDAILYLEDRGYTLAHREMTDTELKKALKVLDILRKDYSKDTIWLSSGDNSIICNPKFEPKEFQGCSVCGIVEAVAKKMGKTVKWIDESY